MATLPAYKWWIMLCFSSGTISVTLRSFLPAIIQSNTHNLGHQQNSTESCTPASTCFVTLLGKEFQYVSYVHYLRSLSAIFEIITTVSLSSLADSRYKPKLFSICLLLVIISSLLFFFVDETQWFSLYLSSILYMVMMSVMALIETIQSSFIPIFMRNGIKGIVASSESFFVANIASLVLLLISIGLSYIGVGMSSIVFLSGALSLISFVFAHYHKMSSTGEELFDIDQKPKFEYGSLFKFKYHELMKLCLSWILQSCAMTNFVMNLNFLFRSTSGVSSTGVQYACFVLASYTSASLVLYFIKNHSSKISSMRSGKWILFFSLVTALSALYSSLGWFLPFGLKNSIEFWVIDVLYIACSSGFRCIIRPIYGSMIPEGLESYLYGVEVVGGLLGTTITGALSAIIQNYTGNGHGCLLMSTALSLLSLWFFLLTDIDSGQKDAQSISLLRD